MPGATLASPTRSPTATGPRSIAIATRLLLAGPPDFVPALIGTPQRSLETFEQWDLADRLQHKGTARINYLIAEIADLAFAGGLARRRLRRALRPARSGRRGRERRAQRAALPAFDAHAFGGVEWRRRQLDSIDSTSSTGTELEPGGVIFPFADAWTARSKARTYAAGAGFSTRPWSRLELRADYQLLISREKIAYEFATAAALAPGVTAADAGNRFPYLRNTDHVVETSARVTLTDWLATRLIYRFQDSRVSNFHQTGLQPRIGHALYLGHVDGDFSAHVVGASAELSF